MEKIKRPGREITFWKEPFFLLGGGHRDFFVCLFFVVQFKFHTMLNKSSQLHC